MFTKAMQKKLVVLFFIILLAFVGLSARLFLITRDNENEYTKQVLSQQQYDSITIPYKRGEILDAKGTSLAVSEKVYNVILDTKILLGKEEYLEPTLKGLVANFGLNEGELRRYIADNPESQYYILKKLCTYDEISGFIELQNDEEVGANIKGVWFEEQYVRRYPNGTLACDVIGFTNGDNHGTYGLEEYYNDTLNGTFGREYGYLNTDSTLERTTIGAVDGDSIVTTIDANIQSIVEKYLKEFSDAHLNEAREGLGANNIGCIIMDVNSGEILSMASYPNFNLSDPYDLTAYYTEEEIATMKESNTYYDTLNGLWRNFCISDTYEPGSVAKPLTVASAIETGAIRGNEVYRCNGYLEIGGYKIRCHNRYGDGDMTVQQSIEQSCNVALMYIAQAMGSSSFLKNQQLFNMGLKTNIDLAGEARTAELINNTSNMGPTELATASFGQGYNVTMIQMITAFSSLVNGGKYYEPHLVSKIISPEGATVKNIEPRILKQTISESTSEKIIEYCNGVVTNGTGKTARPAGYAIGGKTGTAQTLPRGNGEYVVSFMGYAPADDPQIAIYVVVDRPNVERQDDAKFATGIVRNILTEVLPYLNIFQTEELSENEQLELEERERALQQEYQTNTEETTEGSEAEGEGNAEGETAESSESGEEPTEGETTEGETEEFVGQIWKTFPIDPTTGYAVDPDTGEFVDPETGDIIGDHSFMEPVTQE